MRTNIQHPTTTNIQTESLDTAALALMAMPKLEPLPADETRKLQVAEERINAGLESICNSYVEIGRALDQIRERRLYRATHGTFEEYCSERWGRTARWARQRIEGARVAVNLLEFSQEAAEGAEKKPNLPATERVARALVPLEKEEQIEVWQEAVKASPSGKPTAVEVKTHVERRSREQERREDEPNMERWIPMAAKILARCPVTVIGLFDGQSAGEGMGGWSWNNCRNIFDAMVDRGLIKDGKLVGSQRRDAEIAKTAENTESTKTDGADRDKSELLFMAGETLSDLRMTRVRLKEAGGNAPTKETRIRMQELFDSAKSLYKEWMAATSEWDRAAAEISQKVTKETKTKGVTRISRIGTKRNGSRNSQAKRLTSLYQISVIKSLPFLKEIAADQDVPVKLRSAAALRMKKLARQSDDLRALRVY